ncbi:lipoprotein, partial [Brachyspira hampsonii 30599]
TSLIKDMIRLFENSNRENFDGIETWDTSNVTDMSDMFMGAVNFNSNINNWNVSKVTNMFGIF